MITVRTTISRQMAQWINEDNDRAEVTRFFKEKSPNPWYYLADMVIRTANGATFCILQYNPMRKDLRHIPDEIYADIETQIEDFARQQAEKYEETHATYYFDGYEISHEADDFTLSVSGSVTYRAHSSKGDYYTPGDWSEELDIRIDGFSCTDENGDEIKCDFDKSTF